MSTLIHPSNNRSVKQILNTFVEIGEGSRAKINIQKSYIMGLGKWKN